MTYLNNLLYYIKLYSQYFPKLFGLFLFLFLEIIIIYYLTNYTKKPLKNLKIFSLFLNVIYIFIYISIFILLISILRYLRWGYTIDLIHVYTKIIFLYENLPSIALINFVLLIYIIYLVLSIIRKFFHIEILKSFIYYYHKIRLESQKEYKIKNPTKNPEYNMTPLDYPLLVYLYNRIETGWNYKRIVRSFVYNYIVEFYYKIFNKNIFHYFYINIFIKTFLYLPQSFLVFLFIYDCLYNNFNIHLIFYYLPFYFVFHLWESVTYFITNTNSVLNGILYNIYYEENVKFIYVIEEEIIHLELYISRYCRCSSVDIFDQDINIQLEKRDLVRMFGVIFTQNRQYIRTKYNPKIFENPNTGDAVEFTSETLLKTSKIIKQNEIKE